MCLSTRGHSHSCRAWVWEPGVHEMEKKAMRRMAARARKGRHRRVALAAEAMVNSWCWGEERNAEGVMCN